MPEPGTDPLSARAHDIIRVGQYTALVAPSCSPPQARQLLGDVTPDLLLTVPVASPTAAYAMLAGLWLLHDGLSECHDIVQQSALNLHRRGCRTGGNVPLVQAVESRREPDQQQLKGMDQSLSFWHAIMHRREGDFSNSKYWYDRAGAHPIFPALAANAAVAINPLPADKSLLRLLSDGWDPDAFVDLVEQVAARPQDPRLRTVQELQRMEWQMLFDHCTREAAG